MVDNDGFTDYHFEKGSIEKASIEVNDGFAVVLVASFVLPTWQKRRFEGRLMLVGGGTLRRTNSSGVCYLSALWWLSCWRLSCWRLSGQELSCCSDVVVVVMVAVVVEVMYAVVVRVIKVEIRWEYFESLWVVVVVAVFVANVEITTKVALIVVKMPMKLRVSKMAVLKKMVPKMGVLKCWWVL